MNKRILVYSLLITLITLRACAMDCGEYEGDIQLSNDGQKVIYITVLWGEFYVKRKTLASGVVINLSYGPVSQMMEYIKNSQGGTEALYDPCQPLWKKDSDNDGMPDLPEIIAGGDPNDPDSNPWDDFNRDRERCAQGDADACGRLLDSPLYEIDTDGDGYSDGFELQNDTDPTDPFDYGPCTNIDGTRHCHPPDKEPWYPYPDDPDEPGGGDDPDNPGGGDEPGGGYDGGGGDGGDGGNTGGGTGGGGDGGGDTGGGTGGGDGGDTGGGDTGGGDTGGGDDGEDPFEIDLSGIENLLKQILAEEKSIKTSIKDQDVNVNVDLDSTGLGTKIETTNSRLHMLKESLEAGNERRNALLEAMKTDGDRMLSVIGDSLADMFDVTAGHYTTMTDNFFPRYWEQKAREEQQLKDIADSFEMISEAELKTILGDEQFNKLIEKQDALIESIGNLQSGAEGGDLAGVESRLDAVNANLGDNGAIAKEAANIVAILEDQADLSRSIGNVLNAIDGKMAEGDGLAESIKNELESGNAELAGLLREIRDRPDIDLSVLENQARLIAEKLDKLGQADLTGVESRLDEIADKLGTTVRVDVDMSGVESQLSGINDRLDRMLDGEGQGEGDGEGEEKPSGWDGLDAWGKPELTDDMKFGLDTAKHQDELSRAFEGSGIGFSELTGYSPRPFSAEVKIPVGGSLGNIRWHTYHFSMTQFPPEVSTPILTALAYGRTLAQAIMVFIFLRRVWALLWSL